MTEIQTKEYAISILKGILGAIPNVGTFLNEILFEARSRVKQERLNRFLTEFGEYLASHSQKKIDFRLLDKEMVGDMVEEIMISISKTSAIHKRSIFKKILFNQFQPDSSTTEDVLRYISITNSLTESQFKILSTYGANSEIMMNLTIESIELRNKLPAIESKFKKESEYFKEGLANSKEPAQRDLIDIKNKIRSKDEEILNNINPNEHQIYGLDQETFVVEILDLISKGLIYDFAMTSNKVEPFKLFGISKLGKKYISYVAE